MMTEIRLSLIALFTLLGVLIGFMHLGFAFIEDNYPRNVWDIYAAVICIVQAPLLIRAIMQEIKNDSKASS